MRTRRATGEVFKALPAVIAVLDLDRRVDVATGDAERLFGLKPGVRVEDLVYEWRVPLIRRAQAEGRVVEATTQEGYIQIFGDNREYFFAPTVVPILAESGRDEISGTAVILKDVSQVREQQDLKRSAVTTVSHQLRNPLTSIRMSIHLLLEETLGPLNRKQTELLVAAREESERLTGIVEELLDLNRKESGRTLLDIESISPQELVRDSLEPFLVEARDRGVSLANAVRDDLPEVFGDAKRLQHVMANLLSNALRFTDPGGEVSVSAEAEPGMVRVTVTDTSRLLSEPCFGGPSRWFPGWTRDQRQPVLGTTAGFGRFTVLVLLHPEGRSTDALGRDLWHGCYLGWHDPARLVSSRPRGGLELSQALERLNLGLQSPYRSMSLVAVTDDVSGHARQPPRIGHGYPASEPDAAVFWLHHPIGSSRCRLFHHSDYDLYSLCLGSQFRH